VSSKIDHEREEYFELNTGGRFRGTFPLTMKYGARCFPDPIPKSETIGMLGAGKAVSRTGIPKSAQM
jgi:hypothetical protein